jgi:protein-tyrosine phosphatase
MPFEEDSINHSLVLGGWPLAEKQSHSPTVPYSYTPILPYLFLVTFASMKILMVCLGNICRSPLAEGILESKAKKLGLEWEIDSAGTNNSYHIGEAPHPLSQKVAKLNAVDISDQSARAFTADDFDRFDKIYAMSSDIIEHMKRIAKKKFRPEKTDLLLNEVFPGENLDVPDPWFGEEPGYHEVFRMIDKACEKIIEKYGYLKTA